jgi:stress-induced morphogen
MDFSDISNKGNRKEKGTCIPGTEDAVVPFSTHKVHSSVCETNNDSFPKTHSVVAETSDVHNNEKIKKHNYETFYSVRIPKSRSLNSLNSSEMFPGQKTLFRSQGVVNYFMHDAISEQLCHAATAAMVGPQYTELREKTISSQSQYAKKKKSFEPSSYSNLFKSQKSH